jgi:PKD domain
MRFARWGLPALVVVAIAGTVGAPRALARSDRWDQSRRGSNIDARVVGTFEMLARVTAAVNVRGEQLGERLARTWKIVPRRCQGSVCQLLRLDRERSQGRHSHLTLHRVGRGRYSGRGVFYVALSCLGTVYRYGSRVPYRITLTVRGATMVQGIRFAQRITAMYVNPRRSDATRCPLGPSHDAARYTGRASSPVPSPPAVSFTPIEQGLSATLAFADDSTPGLGAAPIVGWDWDFGDPGSGTQDSSIAQNPSHTFSAPGKYTVTLTVTDANGLSSTTRQVVTPS